MQVTTVFLVGTIISTVSFMGYLTRLLPAPGNACILIADHMVYAVDTYLDTSSGNHTERRLRLVDHDFQRGLPVLDSKPVGFPVVRNLRLNDNTSPSLRIPP